MGETNITKTTFRKGAQPRWTQASPAVFQVELGEDKDGPFAMVEGEAARYGNWFQVYDSGPYQIRRRNQAGMFGRSLAQNPDIAFRVNHQDALARTGAGTLQVWETDQALMFRGRLNLQMTTANDVYQAMRDGLITQGSVQFWPTVVEEWSEQNEDKTIQYEDIKEAKIDHGDVSVVLWGANPQCSTSLVQMAEMARHLDRPPQSVADDTPQVEAVAEEPDTTAQAEQAEEPAPVVSDLTAELERATLQFQKSLLADPVKRYISV